VRSGAPAGTTLGVMRISVGAEHLSVPVRSTGALEGPSFTWRLDRF
jgi:hypothetical protein